MLKFAKRLWADENGQDLIEYTLLLAFVALTSAAVYISSGGYVLGIWNTTGSQLANAAAVATAGAS
jgi:Flp pilus assembly pilin Flp